MIYREPTKRNETIHGSSQHPYNITLAAFNNFVYKLISLPLDKQIYEQKVDRIKHNIIFKQQNISIVNKLITKNKNRIPVIKRQS